MHKRNLISPSAGLLLRCSFSLCRGGMGEALWIRRGTMHARMACRIMLMRHRILRSTARERPHRALDLRTLQHSVFIVLSIYLCAKRARDSRLNQTANTCFYRRGDLQCARYSNHNNIYFPTAALHAQMHLQLQPGAVSNGYVHGRRTLL